MRPRIIYILATAISMALSAGGCAGTSSLEDGFYSSEMAEYSHGWKEYLIIQVKDDKIVSAEYNAKNASGFIKSWDNSYMKDMVGEYGTYPNKYTREYVQQLLDGQTDVQVDTVSGATSSGKNFEKLVQAALEKAAAGGPTTAAVE